MFTNKTHFRIFAVFAIMLLFSQYIYGQYPGHVYYNGGHSDERSAASIIGTSNVADGLNSFAGGALSNAHGEQSFAFGLQCEAAFNNSIALGNFAKANAGCSYAFGMEIKAESANSFVIGSGADGNHMLVNDIYGGGIMMGTKSNLPTFFISKSGGIGRTGRIGIGNVTDPQAKLHIKGDGGTFNEDASILLEPTDTEKVASIQFWDNDKFIKVNHDGLMHIKSSDILLSNDVITPAAKLHIRSDEGEDAGIILEPKQPEANGTFIRLHDGNHGISVGTNGEMCISSGAENNKLPLTLNGHVGINTTNDLTNYQYALTVDGGILTDRVLIKSVDEWYDAVFADSYRLMPLCELKDFVAAHHHLPEVPAESEVMEQGYDMGEMQGLLLKKIEELTLYILQQEERIAELEKELKAK